MSWRLAVAGVTLGALVSAIAAPAAGSEPARWAYLLQDAVALERPSPGAARVTVVKTSTPEGESNVVRILEERRDSALRDWVRVSLAVLPHGRSGWMLRSALGEIREARVRLVIDRSRFEAVVYRDGTRAFRAPVGIGLAQWPTPAGEFYVRVRLRGFDDPFYGPVAFGTSARSAVLTDWPGGGFVGIHGTDSPELLPGRVSHGCIRMRNDDIRRLWRLLPVGTPITIR